MKKTRREFIKAVGLSAVSGVAMGFKPIRSLLNNKIREMREWQKQDYISPQKRKRNINDGELD